MSKSYINGPLFRVMVRSNKMDLDIDINFSDIIYTFTDLTINAMEQISLLPDGNLIFIDYPDTRLFSIKRLQ